LYRSPEELVASTALVTLALSIRMLVEEFLYTLGVINPGLAGLHLYRLGHWLFVISSEIYHFLLVLGQSLDARGAVALRLNRDVLCLVADFEPGIDR
jgi:hypothetical protein